jgi:hypothetical protein
MSIGAEERMMIIMRKSLLISCAMSGILASFLLASSADAKTPSPPAAASQPPTPICSPDDVAEIDKLAKGFEASEATDSPFTVAHGLVTFTLTKYLSTDHAVVDGNFFRRTSTEPQTKTLIAGQSFTFVRCSRVMTARIAKIWVIKKGEKENPDTDHAQIQIYFRGR